MAVVNLPDETSIAFRDRCEVSQELFEEKNAQYDSAFKKYGLIGVIFELLGALNRLAPMTIWAPNMGRDTPVKLRDILMDIHNYANMALICMDENNWDGRPEDPNAI